MPSKKNPNKIIVVDLEATCWENDPEPYPEIIEIGMVTVISDNGFSLNEPSRIKVRPTTTKISEYCTKLTGWTWKELRRDAVPFKAACKQIVKKGFRNCVFGSWGNDQNLIKTQCKREKIEYPLGTTFLNIQNLFAIKYGLNKEPSLEDALKMLEMNFIGRQHSGMDDAYNTALILIELLK